MTGPSSYGNVLLNPHVPFNAVKVFSATMMTEREHLGSRITEWIASGPAKQIIEIIVTQSSDEAFHCLTFTIFYRVER